MLRYPMKSDWSYRMLDAIGITPSTNACWYFLQALTACGVGLVLFFVALWSVFFPLVILMSKFESLEGVFKVVVDFMSLASQSSMFMRSMALLGLIVDFVVVMGLFAALLFSIWAIGRATWIYYDLKLPRFMKMPKVSFKIPESCKLCKDFDPETGKKL